MRVKWKQVDVQHEDKRMKVFYPDSGDKIETRDLEQFAIEKTTEDLRKQPPREKPKHSKTEVAEALKEYKKFQNRQKDTNKRKYY